ncbi:ankyrin repeat and zinc finger domain-containing protein 1 isoform X1 [Olea europaea var. sylvestris]|uniref:ankyrin repeat and zinc finger domain-containing protein 1 isoform X1 n=1 Tax=Olea europaea var. sylvestris TaxID=158386 RepID=UPI000C1D02DD|nr:ankyrin repeat and zinc finger domain-containing protein 1 isoform X1 [Olea europaea var. sylvestris]
MASAVNQPTKEKPDEPQRRRSIFELPQDFFDSCHLLRSPSASISDYTSKLSIQNFDDAVEESKPDEEIISNNNDVDVNNSSSYKNNNVNVTQRWSCNTCKVEFESLQDQRSHFKSDIHRFNIKLSIAGKEIIKEEDFDETSGSLNKDYDISSISGSEDEDERETGHFDDRQHGFGGISKNKILIQLQTGERISIWKSLLVDESVSISFENDKSAVIDGRVHMPYLTDREVTGKLKSLICEPRDKTHLRIVLLARGGHFAGCVFDGNSIVAHRTFHRYVVRAKAGKKQSSKDASARGIHSAGASLRRYNELALKKDIQELLTAWKPHFSVSSCIFLHAPSNNRQLFFEGEKPYFICQHHAIRNIPLTIRRPTFREAKRVYNLLTQISPEISKETTINTKENVLSGATIVSSGYPDSSRMELRENLEIRETIEASSSVEKIDNLSVSSEEEMDGDLTGGISTALHEAAMSGNAQKVLELLEQGLDPCIKDERGRTPYMLASEKEVRNTFRRFMASNLDKWDWQAAKVPGVLTKEMEESQAAKQAEKDAKRKAKAKERKKLRRAKEKKDLAEAAESQNTSVVSECRGATPISSHKGHSQSSRPAIISKEEELKRIQDAEREKRAAAAERRIAALRARDTGSVDAPSNTAGTDILCSCCHTSLAGKVPFHRYNYKYCSTSCMHIHREILEDE